jgi:transcriptional regulator with XRE-family HTH domain
MDVMATKKTKPSSKATSFGDRLAELRKLRGLTQVQLAEKLGSTQRAITYYENEADYPPVETIVELARILGVSTDELLGVKVSKPPQDVIDITTNPELRNLWRKFQQVATWPEKDQNAVIRLINTVSKSVSC